MGDTYSNTTHHKSLKVVVFVQWRKIAKKKIKEIEIRLMMVLLLEKSILNFKTKRWQKKKIIQRVVKLYFYCEKWSNSIIYTFSNLQVIN